MITTERIYREGFLDGMRHSGHLLSDLDDTEINLTHECECQIHRSYSEREYGKVDLIRTLTADCNRLYDEVQRLQSVDNSDSDE